MLKEFLTLLINRCLGILLKPEKTTIFLVCRTFPFRSKNVNSTKVYILCTQITAGLKLQTKGSLLLALLKKGIFNYL